MALGGQTTRRGPAPTARLSLAWTIAARRPASRRLNRRCGRRRRHRAVTPPAPSRAGRAPAASAAARARGAGARFAAAQRGRSGAGCPDAARPGFLPMEVFSTDRR